MAGLKNILGNIIGNIKGAGTRTNEPAYKGTYSSIPEEDERIKNLMLQQNQQKSLPSVPSINMNYTLPQNPMKRTQLNDMMY